MFSAEDEAATEGLEERENVRGVTQMRDRRKGRKRRREYGWSMSNAEKSDFHTQT